MTSPRPRGVLDTSTVLGLRAGRKTSAGTYDALIAATALANGLPLYTAKPGDFAGIDGLEVVEVTFP